VWPTLEKAHLNTALIGVGWGWTEPEEGKYDFSALDGALRDARNSNLRVVLLCVRELEERHVQLSPGLV